MDTHTRAVLRHSPNYLTATERIVYAVLADAANTKGEVWLAQATVAERTGLTDRTVRSALTELVASNALIPIGGTPARTRKFIVAIPEADSDTDTDNLETPSGYPGSSFHHPRKQFPVNPEALSVIPEAVSDEVTIRDQYKTKEASSESLSGTKTEAKRGRFYQGTGWIYD